MKSLTRRLGYLQLYLVSLMIHGPTQNQYKLNLLNKLIWMEIIG